MNSNALKKINPHYFFILILVLYSLYYALAESPYVYIIYGSPIETFNKLVLKNSTYIFYDNFYDDFFYNLKKIPHLIHLLFLIKTSLFLFLLNDTLRRTAALSIIFLTCLFLNLSNIMTPELFYLNYIYIIMALYPKSFNLLKTDAEKISPTVYHILWFVFGLSYTVSGIYKLITPEWYSGVFLQNFVNSNHNFNIFFNFIAPYPFILKVITYCGLLIELMALPLCVFRRTRHIALLNLTLLQVGLLLIANIQQITLGMIVFHFFMLLCLPSKSEAR